MISKIPLKKFLKDNINDNKKTNIKKRIQNNLSLFFMADLFVFPKKLTGKINSVKK
jgi:hypothetical protein